MSDLKKPVETHFGINTTTSTAILFLVVLRKEGLHLLKVMFRGNTTLETSGHQQIGR